MGCAKSGRGQIGAAGHSVLASDSVGEHQGGGFYFTLCIWPCFREKVALE